METMRKRRSWSEDGESENRSGSEPHPDYDRNVERAQQYLANRQSTFPADFGITSPTAPSDSCVIVHFFTDRRGRWAYPVSLHQPHLEFCSELEKAHKQYELLQSVFLKQHDRAAPPPADLKASNDGYFELSGG